MSGFPVNAITSTTNLQIYSLGVGTAATGVTGQVALSGGTTITGGGNLTLAATAGVINLNSAGVTLTVNAGFLQFVSAGTGIDTHSAGSVTTGTAIVSGTAFTPSSSVDSFVNINVVATTAGTVTVTFGPTTGAENTWAPSTILLAGMGENIGIWVPSTWKVVVTLTGVTVSATWSSYKT